MAYSFQGGSISRAKSIDSISTDLDDVCGKNDTHIMYDNIMYGVLVTFWNYSTSCTFELKHATPTS